MTKRTPAATTVDPGPDQAAETARRLDAAGAEVRQAAETAQAALCDLAVLAEAYDAAVAEAVNTARQAGTDVSLGRDVHVGDQAYHRVDVGLLLAEVLRRVAEAKLGRVHGLRTVLAAFGLSERWRIAGLTEDLPPVPASPASTYTVPWPDRAAEIASSHALFGSESARYEAERQRDQAYVVREIGRYR